MRKAIFGILMAAVAMPASAWAQDGGEARSQRVQERYERQGERNQARSDRQEARQERQEARVERPAQPEPQRQQRVEQRQERVEQRQERVEQRQDRVDRVDQRVERVEQRAERRDDRGGDREAYRQQILESRAASQQSANQNVPGNYARQGARNEERYGQTARGDRREDRRDWRNDRRDDRRDWRSDRRDDRRDRWDRNWRYDNRYDWQRYRYSNRNVFRVGSYYSPYRNHRYNRFSIGLVLDSLFFSSRYWINDPYQYRLPHAYPGTRWVRYYNDVLLVDTYSGEVIDVIYDFFW